MLGSQGAEEEPEKKNEKEQPTRLEGNVLSWKPKKKKKVSRRREMIRCVNAAIVQTG